MKKSNHVQLNFERSIRVPHNRLTFGEEEVQAVADVVSSGQWAGGPRLAELEKALAERAQVTYAVGVASGLGALRLALKGLGVKPGDEVIVPAYSCVALANALMALGAKPIPVDVCDSNWNLDPESARLAITSRTRALVLVNTFGAAAPIADLQDLNIPLIEDCAHGFGLQIDGSIMGGRGDAAVLSFCATKLMGAGEGGAVLTNKRDLDEFVHAWRDYGDQPPDPTRLNEKMNDLEAALAICQLRRLDSMLIARKKAALYYSKCLAPEAKRTGAFRLPQSSENQVWYRYVIEMTSASASIVIERLRRRGIHAECPVTDWRSDDAAQCPTADRAYDRLVSLPLYPTLQPGEQQMVCEALSAVVQELSYA